MRTIGVRNVALLVCNNGGGQATGEQATGGGASGNQSSNGTCNCNNGPPACMPAGGVIRIQFCNCLGAGEMVGCWGGPRRRHVQSPRSPQSRPQSASNGLYE